jgi:hypothetical protein
MRLGFLVEDAGRLGAEDLGRLLGRLGPLKDDESAAPVEALRFVS